MPIKSVMPIKDVVRVEIEDRIYREMRSWAEWAHVDPRELVNRALRQWLANQERTLGNDDYAEEWLMEDDA